MRDVMFFFKKGVFKMKSIFIISILMSLLFIYFSCSDSTSSNEDKSIKLALSADKTTGSSPLEVNFIATLSGAKIDTIKLYYPPSSLYHGTGKTVIIWAQQDTFVYAKHEYTSRYTYSVPPDTYYAFYVLHGLNGNIVSDTLEIVITP